MTNYITKQATNTKQNIFYTKYIKNKIYILNKIYPIQ